MRLTIASGTDAGRALDLSGPVVIGRDESCDLVLDDERVSRNHCRLLPQPDGTVLLEDLGSSNGTFVRGERIRAPTSLRGGEELRVGSTLLRVEGAPATVVGAPATRLATTPPEPPAQPPAGPPPPPPPAAPPGSGGEPPWYRTKWAAIVGLAALAVIGGTVGGVIAATSGGEPETVAVTETVETASTVTVPVTVVDTGAVVDTTSATPSGDELLAHVPEEIRSSCGELDPESEYYELDGVVVAVGCDVDGGAITAVYLQMESNEAMDSQYAAQAGDIPRDTGSCASDAQAEGTYTTNGEAAGRLVCYREDDFEVYWWTSDALAILTVAGGEDAAAVNEFWVTAGPV